MAWTTPKNWSDGEMPTGAMLTTHLRDNLQYLKDVLDGAQGQNVLLTIGSTDAIARQVQVRKARGSIGVPSAVVAADNLFDLYGMAYNGGAYQAATLIRSLVTGVGATYVDGQIEFFTFRSSDGGALRALALTGGTAQFSDGVVGVPGLGFIADPDSGIYRIGADNWALGAGGSKVLEILKSGANLQVLFPDGVAAAPGMAFSSETGTGWRLAAAGSMTLMIGGSQHININNSTGAVADSNHLVRVDASLYTNGQIWVGKDIDTTKTAVSAFAGVWALRNSGGAVVGYIPFYTTAT